MTDEIAEGAFHRPPREWPEPPPADELRIHAPPPRPEPPSGGWIQALFPVLGSFTMVAFAVVYRNRLFLYIAFGLVLLSMLFAAAMRWSQYHQVRKRRERNRVKYRQHLWQVERELEQVQHRQRQVGDRLYPDHERLWGLVLQRQHLWERRAGDPDFLELRVGRGPVALARPIRLELADDPLTERELDLEDQAATVRARWANVPDAPVTLDLRDAQVVSIVGPPDLGRGLARSLVSQLAAFRAPSDVRMLAAFDRGATAEWEWMKWLPHARAEVRARQDAPSALPPPVLLASSPEALAAMLEGELGPRLEQLRRIDEESVGSGLARVSAPRLVVFVDGYAPDGAAARLPALREAMANGARLQVTVVTLADSAAREPSEADARIVIARNGAATVEERGADGRRYEGVAGDDANLGLSEAIARSLAPLRLAARDSGRTEADEVRQLDLLGLPTASALDLARSWAPRPPNQELRVPIGLNEAGEPVVLDLKQAAEGGMGPHGLLVGATGSGKSELMRTLVSSLAVTHSPETLAFVLIDYKGGAAFAELAKLPHTAGLITNLQQDGSLVDRMRDALIGEQERRQRMLREAGDLDDIRAYRAARAGRPELEPMPHLVVVVDEFGELLAARPEFIDVFLGIGRVGRSLGMHLLFSSQRLEEGRLRGLDSHLRYRLCLRTYSGLDSKVVLGTTDAYLLPPYPGAAYLKVDTSLYERFKVSLVSTHERAESPAAALTEVSPFAPGAPLALGAAGDAAEGGGGATDLDELVELMRAAHDGHVHQVWAPPLEPAIPLAEVEPAGGDLCAAVGVVDVPAEQRREPLALDFAGSAGHLAIVGAPQTGKTTLVRSLACALARSNRPDEARMYVIDLGGGLGDLTAIPHVGDVATKADRDKVRQTVRHMQAIVDRRELEFRRHGLGSMRDARAARARGKIDADLADVFLVVDGWAALRREFEELDHDVEHLAGVGLGYGVHVVITANRWNEMRPSLRDNVGGRLELRLNDPIESEVGRRVAEGVPADTPGRGLTAAGLHFQAALPDPSLVPDWDGPAAPPVPVLPLRLEARELPPAQGAAIAIGVDEMGLEPALLDLAGADSHFMVLGDSEAGKTNLLRLIARRLTDSQDPGRVRLAIVDYRRGLLDLSELPHVHSYAASAAMASDAVAALRGELAGRLPGPNATREELLGGPAWSGPRFLLLVDDYDLVPGAIDNPLAPLVDLLAHGRDIGLHVVLARRVAGTARSAFEPFFQRLSELRPPGLLMSGDPGEGPLLGGRRAAPLPPGRGLLVRRDGRASLIQTALATDPPAGEVARLHQTLGGKL